MLLDNKERLAELIVDNILWGNLKLDYDDLERKDKLFHDLKTFSDTLRNWETIKNNTDLKQKQKTISYICDEFYAFRITHIAKGELRDRDSEIRIKELERDNYQLAEKLSQAYIPSKDGKIGTT